MDEWCIVFKNNKQGKQTQYFLSDDYLDEFTTPHTFYEKPLRKYIDGCNRTVWVMRGDEYWANKMSYWAGIYSIFKFQHK